MNPLFVGCGTVWVGTFERLQADIRVRVSRPVAVASGIESFRRSRGLSVLLRAAVPRLVRETRPMIGSAVRLRHRAAVRVARPGRISAQS
jgi:hypothetical protein